jgi:hypothetical protein
MFADQMTVADTLPRMTSGRLNRQPGFLWLSASGCVPKVRCGLAGIDLVLTRRGTLLRGRCLVCFVLLLPIAASAWSPGQKPATRTGSSRIAGRSGLIAGYGLVACLHDESHWQFDPDLQ